MTDKTASLHGDMDESRTVKLTITPDGLYPTFQFIEFRTVQQAEQYVAIANGKCDKDGNLDYRAEIVQNITVRKADGLQFEVGYLNLDATDYDNARSLVGDSLKARPGMVGWRFKAAKNIVVKTGRDEYKVFIPSGLDYTLKAVGEEAEDGVEFTKYQLLGYGGVVMWEHRWVKGEVPRKLLEAVEHYAAPLMD